MSNCVIVRASVIRWHRRAAVRVVVSAARCSLCACFQSERQRAYGHIRARKNVVISWRSSRAARAASSSFYIAIALRLRVYRRYLLSAPRASLRAIITAHVLRSFAHSFCLPAAACLPASLPVHCRCHGASPSSTTYTPATYTYYLASRCIAYLARLDTCFLPAAFCRAAAYSSVASRYRNKITS